MKDGYLTEIIVTHGINPHTKAGSVGGVDTYFDDEELPTVILSLGQKDGPSGRVHLHEGDTFELGPELWEVTEITEPNTDYWAAVLNRLR